GGACAAGGGRGGGGGLAGGGGGGAGVGPGQTRAMTPVRTQPARSALAKPNRSRSLGWSRAKSTPSACWKIEVMVAPVVGGGSGGPPGGLAGGGWRARAARTNGRSPRPAAGRPAGRDAPRWPGCGGRQGGD